jgi:putative ABC transport system permease protein
MGWVMMVVGGLALASTMGMAVLERQREIGVLRAIGASPRAVMGLVLAEGLMVTLMAWLASLPLAAPIGLLLGEAFGRMMFSVTVQPWPEPRAALQWLAVMTLLALVACAVPAWRAMRMTTARALAYAG